MTATALRLFREDGYQATTMRRIATEAGVSLGNALNPFVNLVRVGLLPVAPG